MAVTFDTNVFATLLEPPRLATEDALARYRDSHALLRELRKERADIIVPTVVIGELMSTTMRREERSRFVRELMRRDMVFNLDFAAGLLAGELTAMMQDLGLWPRKKSEKNDRDWTRCDCFIAATAYMHAVQTIYTYNLGDFEPINMALERMQLTPFKLLTPPPSPGHKVGRLTGHFALLSEEE